MTLLVVTKSHGEIESGFCGLYTPLVRFGEYSFPIRSMCDLTRQLAEHSEIKKANLFVYSDEKFWRDRSKQSANLIRNITRNIQNAGELNDEVLKDAVASLPMNASLEDTINLNNDAKSIPIIVSPDEESISIGIYDLEQIHFGRFATYLAQGGILGWITGQKPDYADPTLEAIKKSQRGLFRKVRTEI